MNKKQKIQMGLTFSLLVLVLCSNVQFGVALPQYLFTIQPLGYIDNVYGPLHAYTSDNSIDESGILFTNNQTDIGHNTIKNTTQTKISGTPASNQIVNQWIIDRNQFNDSIGIENGVELGWNTAITETGFQSYKGNEGNFSDSITLEQQDDFDSQFYSYLTDPRANGQFTYLSSHDSHLSVIRYSGSGSLYSWQRTNIEEGSMSSDIVLEWYFQQGSTATNYGFGFGLMRQSDNRKFSVTLAYNRLELRDASGITQIPYTQDREFHHYSLRYNGTNRLSQIYVDGVLKGSKTIETGLTEVNSIFMESGWGAIGPLYFDAIGCSLDGTYQQGNNLNVTQTCFDYKYQTIGTKLETNLHFIDIASQVNLNVSVQYTENIRDKFAELNISSIQYPEINQYINISGSDYKNLKRYLAFDIAFLSQNSGNSLKPSEVAVKLKIGVFQSNGISGLSIVDKLLFKASTLSNQGSDIMSLAMDYLHRTVYGLNVSKFNHLTEVEETGFIKSHFKEPTILIRFVYSNYQTIEPYPDENSMFKDLFIEKPEPVIEEDREYWSYSSFSIETDYIAEVQISNVTYEFKFIKGVKTDNKFYYDTSNLESDKFGNWNNWNWLRDGIVRIINGLILVGQMLNYLLTVAFNYLILYLLCMFIIPFLNNTVLYWIAYISVYVGVKLFDWIIGWIQWIGNAITWLWENVIYPVILWVWDALQAFLEFLWQDIILPIFTWIYENIIIPIWNYIVQAYEWFITDGITILINWYITFVSWVLAIIIYIFSFGSVDIMVIQSSIASTITNINDMFYEFIGIFFGNFVLLLSYFLTYMLEIGLVFLKKVYCQAKGYNNRAQKLQASIDVFKLPIIIPIRLIQYLLAFVGQDSAPTTE